MALVFATIVCSYTMVKISLILQLFCSQVLKSRRLRFQLELEISEDFSPAHLATSLLPVAVNPTLSSLLLLVIRNSRLERVVSLVWSRTKVISRLLN